MELQAELPEPSARTRAWLAKRNDGEGPFGLAAGATADFGLWGALLAVPAAVLWWLTRRLRRR